jgi:hypothetical protein
VVGAKQPVFKEEEFKLDIKQQLQGGCLRVLHAGIAILLASGGLNAAALWTNGSFVTPADVSTYRCDSVCGTNPAPPNQWTIFDNFTVPSGPLGWAVSGFDYTDLLVGTATTEYSKTNWSLWKGDPLNGGTLVASSLTTPGTFGITPVGGASCPGTFNNCTVDMITVNFTGGSVVLAPGQTYYLGSSSVMGSSSDVSFRAFATGGNTAPGGVANGLVKWEQSMGSTTGTIGSTWSVANQGNWPNYTSGQINNPAAANESATMFDINGQLAPEPGTITLLGIALGGLCYLRRRKAPVV